MILLTEASSLLLALAPAFTQPTFHRLVTLLAAALLTTGRRTVANLLRTLRLLAPGHRTSYQRGFSSARWSGLPRACLRTRFLLTPLLPAGVVPLVGDDTVDGPKGQKVYGKARHRDAVRSSHSSTAWRYGHQGVVLAVLVRFAFATRPWALPVVVALYRSPDLNRQRRRPHRTPAQLLRRLLRLVLLWCPGRTFVFVGDAGYGTHELARFAPRHRARLTLISKFHPKANLYLPPPPYAGKGRPRVKGAALPKPPEAAAAAKQRREVGWYGGGQRAVETAHGTGGWYKSGAGLVEVGWVFVQDRTGTHREEYFFRTDPTLDVATILSLYTGRWNIETTFPELRCCLGLETTRGWCQQTGERVAPCLFGLYTVVAVLYQALPERLQQGAVGWPGKATVPFGDALAAVRRWLWQEWVFPQAEGGTVIAKLPEQLREIVFSALSPAW